MKLLRSLILLISLVFFSISTFSQFNSGINYQSVVRELNGEPVVNTPVFIKAEIRSGSSDGILVYSEEHTTETNSIGLLSLSVGNGDNATNNLNDLSWGTDDHYLRIYLSVDGGGLTEYGSTVLKSVPYSYYAQNSKNAEMAKVAETAINVDDADADPENELISTIDLVGSDLVIVEGGVQSSVDLSGLGGGEVDLDADPGNELQDISIEGHTLSLTGLNSPTTFNLFPYLDNTDEQTLSLTGTSLSISGGNSVEIPANKDEQTLSVSGSTLSISDGNSVQLPVDTALWTEDDNGINYANGNIGLGESSHANYRVILNGSGTNGLLATASGTDNFALKGKSLSTGGIGVYGENTNTDYDITYGGYFKANATKGIGLYSESTGRIGVGLKGVCEDGTGIAARGGDYALHAQTLSETTYEYDGLYSRSDAVAVRGVTNYGIGGHFTSYSRAVVGVAYAVGDYDENGYYVDIPDGEYVGGYFVGHGNTIYDSYGIGVDALGGSIGVKAESYGTGVWAEGTDYDFYAAGSGTNYGPFTGAHDALLKNSTEDIKPGMIVSNTGKVAKRIDKNNNVSLSSTLPTVKLANSENDKAVFGIFVKEKEFDKDFWYQEEGARGAIINALGEGRVWVCSVNGNIEAGDYISSSIVPGYGQKQSDDLLHNYTVAKATETINWEEVTEIIVIDGVTYKVYLLAVVYVCG